MCRDIARAVLVADLAVPRGGALVLGMEVLPAVWEDAGVSVCAFGGPFYPNGCGRYPAPVQMWGCKRRSCVRHLIKALSCSRLGARRRGRSRGVQLLPILGETEVLGHEMGTFPPRGTSLEGSEVWGCREGCRAVLLHVASSVARHKIIEL